MAVAATFVTRRAIASEQPDGQRALSLDACAAHSTTQHSWQHVKGDTNFSRRRLSATTFFDDSP
jgi:uncharacterized protein YijF (DUF1287 family)